MRYLRRKTLKKYLEDEIHSMEDIFENSDAFYKSKGKTDYDMSVEANYLQGRMDALESVIRHIEPRKKEEPVT